MGIEAMKEERRSGRPRKIKTPEEMWALACEYFASVDANPLMATDVVRGGKEAGRVVEIPKKRPYSWAGFETFLAVRKGMMSSGVIEYRTNRHGAYDIFSEVIRAINQAMYENKFDGATSGLFNPAVVIRDLGMQDRSEVTHIEQPVFGDAEEMPDGLGLEGEPDGGQPGFRFPAKTFHVERGGETDPDIESIL